MVKLTEKERNAFERILSSDLDAINAKFMNQIKDFWDIGRKEIKHRRGWDTLELEKQELEKKINECKNRVHQIESEIQSEPLRPEQIIELGGKCNKYGRYSGSHFYGIPVEGQFDYDIVEYIREHIDIEIPSKILRDICSASIRELTMAGTFEEARMAYEKFYSLDFRRYGVDIPPRLDEIRHDKKLLTYAQDSLKLPEKIKKEMLPESTDDIIEIKKNLIKNGR